MDINEYDKLKTPCYIIDKQKFIDNTDGIRAAFKDRWGDNITLGYSVKTNHFPYLMQLSKSLGYYAEVVSGSESRDQKEFLIGSARVLNKSYKEVVDLMGTIRISNRCVFI